MTLLTKTLARETELLFDHQGRSIIIEIDPPGLITLREKGRRRRFTATASWVLQMIAEREAGQKKAKRKPRRGLIHH